MYPKDLLDLINFLKKLSGVGTKTAQRYAFEIFKWNENELNSLSSLIKNLKKNIVKCKNCKILISGEYCKYCDPHLRDTKKICIVSSFQDFFLIENTRSYKGVYHIIDNLLSPVEDKELEMENFEKLKSRIKKYNTEEVIIALDSTVEGDATSLFIKEELKNFNIKISRLAFGLPVGTSLDYIDGGTLTQAFIGRQKF